jgi:hypothetical protein
MVSENTYPFYSFAMVAAMVNLFDGIIKSLERKKKLAVYSLT